MNNFGYPIWAPYVLMISLLMTVISLTWFKRSPWFIWAHRVICWRKYRRQKAIKNLYHYCRWLRHENGHDNALLLVQEMTLLMKRYSISPCEFGLQKRTDIGRLAIDSLQNDIATKKARLAECENEIVGKLHNLPFVSKESFIKEVARLGVQHQRLLECTKCENDQWLELYGYLDKHRLLAHGGKMV